MSPNPAASCSADGYLGRGLPEVLVEVFVFQDAKHQRLVVLENRAVRAIQRMNLPKEGWPTSAIRSGFQSGLVPLTVERMEVDPLVEQDLVRRRRNGLKRFDFGHPTARSMKTDRGGMLAADGRQSLFVRLPLAAQVVNGLRRSEQGICPLFVFRQSPLHSTTTEIQQTRPHCARLGEMDPHWSLCSHVRQNVGRSTENPRSGERGDLSISAGPLSRRRNRHPGTGRSDAGGQGRPRASL